MLVHHGVVPLEFPRLPPYRERREQGIAGSGGSPANPLGWPCGENSHGTCQTGAVALVSDFKKSAIGHFIQHGNPF
jgi:hypothetical protein